MVEHKNPAGAYTGDCEFCGALDTQVKLRMANDRYKWGCTDVCRFGNPEKANPKRSKR